MEYLNHLANSAVPYKFVHVYYDAPIDLIRLYLLATLDAQYDGSLSRLIQEVTGSKLWEKQKHRLEPLVERLHEICDETTFSWGTTKWWWSNEIYEISALHNLIVMTFQAIYRWISKGSAQDRFQQYHIAIPLAELLLLSPDPHQIEDARPNVVDAAYDAAPGLFMMNPSLSFRDRLRTNTSFPYRMDEHVTFWREHYEPRFNYETKSPAETSVRWGTGYQRRRKSRQRQRRRAGKRVRSRLARRRRRYT